MVSSAVPTRAMANAFALAGFAVAMIAGLAAGNGAARVVATALVALVVCQIVGTIAASVMERAVREHLDQLSSARAASKRPQPEAAAGSTGAGVGSDGAPGRSAQAPG